MQYGSKKISKVKYGEKNIIAVYWGNKKVWGSLNISDNS